MENRDKKENRENPARWASLDYKVLPDHLAVVKVSKIKARNEHSTSLSHYNIFLNIYLQEHPDQLDQKDLVDIEVKSKARFKEN